MDGSLGWFVKMRQYVFHDAVGGATNGKFWLETWARQGIEAVWSPHECIRSTLKDAIDPTLKVLGKPFSLPQEGQLGSFQGLLNRQDRDQPVLANTIFQDECIKRI